MTHANLLHELPVKLYTCYWLQELCRITNRVGITELAHNSFHHPHGLNILN